jgi:hypothetical protein
MAVCELHPENFGLVERYKSKASSSVVARQWSVSDDYM